MKRSVCLILAVIVAFVTVKVVFTPVYASGIVGTGTPESCTEATLDMALAGGGAINFFCGAAPVVIPITKEKMISQNTTLDGGGLVTISGKNQTRVFHVVTGGELDLNKITLAYGAAMDPTDGSNQNGSGGGILNEGGTVKMTDATITTSRADHNGGGIYNRGGTLLLVRVTISGNYVPDNGAGILNEKGTITLGNVTLSSNFAGRNGGGLFNFGGTATLIHTTIYNNNSGLSGSGILNTQDGTTKLVNTIVGNPPAGGSPVTGNCTGTITDGGKNLQFPDTSCGTTIPASDPQLGTLADNGNYVLTHALKSSSPAIDKAANDACQSDPINKLDARNVVRPFGAACDIGAYEYDPKHPGKGFDQGFNIPGTITIINTNTTTTTTTNTTTNATTVVTVSVPLGSCQNGFLCVPLPRCAAGLFYDANKPALGCQRCPIRSQEYNAQDLKCECVPPLVLDVAKNACLPPTATPAPPTAIPPTHVPTVPPQCPGNEPRDNKGNCCPIGTVLINGVCIQGKP